MPTPGHPPEVEALSRYDSIQLFLRRAQAVRPGFELAEQNAVAIAEICSRLDGLPLAIEPAAARIRLFPPQALLARLANRLWLLTGGPRNVPARQQTLRQTIDWSYSLLSEGERQLFTRLSVLAGRWTLEAAEAVCNADGDLGIEVLDGVASLVERSLVRQEGSDESRFGMLETIREYASGRLEARGEAEQLQRQHAAYCLLLAEAEAPEPNLISVGHVPWLDRPEEEQDNLRTALRWSLQHGEVEIGLRLAAALHPFWTLRGYAHEGRRWLRDLLALPSLAPAPLRAAAVRAAARLAMVRGDVNEVGQLAREQLELYRALDVGSGMADALHTLAEVVTWQGDPNHGRQFLEQGLSLTREIENRPLVALFLSNLAWTALEWMNDCSRAKPLAEEALALYRELEDVGGVAAALVGLGDVGRARGDPERIIACCTESLALFRQLGNLPFVAYSLHNLGLASWYQGDYHRAVKQIQEALSLFRSAEFMTSLGLVMLDQGRYSQARELLVESVRKAESLVPVGITATSLEGLARIAVHQGQAARAGKLLGAADALRARCGTPIWPAIRPLSERHLEAVRAALGDEGFRAAWEEGRGMTEEQAITYVLEEGVPI